MVNYSNFFSGLFGAVLGILCTFLLYWHDRYSNTRRALADKLIILRYDVWWECEDKVNKVLEAWNASLKELWLLFNAYYEFAPPWKRRCVGKAWEKYKGIDLEIQKNLPEVPDTKMNPKSKTEFIQRINTFLEALGSCGQCISSKKPKPHSETS
jgi:hypothetical protein